MTEEKASRNIPLAELYSHLQLEFISYFLRSKIYCKDFAANYKNVCDIKRDKIEKISLKNGLPSIFNDINCKRRYLGKFFNEYGIPNFTYRDEGIKHKMSCWDMYYFFQKGCSVKFVINNTILVGNVLENDKSSCVVSVIDENKVSHDLYYDNVSRLFSEDYFTF